jgi:hypothetical protein
MGETPSFVPLPGSRPLLIEALRRRRRTDSTPRAPPRTPVRDALSSWRDHLAAIDVSRSRALHLLTETGGPFAGDGWCVHHHRRGFVTRSPVGRRALASASRRPPLRETSASALPMTRRCVRPTSAHPRIRKRAPIVSCGDRVSRFRRDVLRRLDLFRRPVRTVFSRHRARFGGSRSREIGRFLPVLHRALCATSDTPVTVPEPRVAISREIKLRVRPRSFRFRAS